MKRTTVAGSERLLYPYTDAKLKLSRIGHLVQVNVNLSPRKEWFVCTVSPMCTRNLDHAIMSRKHRNLPWTPSSVCLSRKQALSLDRQRTSTLKGNSTSRTKRGSRGTGRHIQQVDREARLLESMVNPLQQRYSRAAPKSNV